MKEDKPCKGGIAKFILVTVEKNAREKFPVLYF